MSDKRHNGISRRHFFFMAGAAAAAGCSTLNKPKVSRMSPNEKLNIAGVGVGGQGHGDMSDIVRDTENVVALCDVDWARGENSFKKWPNARKYKDYREMLDKEANNIDAVVVATPDHMHAFAASAAMELGKHVYVEKPLTHSLYEARHLLKLSRKYGVSTQMGNQGHSGDGVRQMCEMVWAKLVGDIKEVHIWTNRPVWPQGVPHMLPPQPVPDTMDWDLWIGAAPYREYNSAYAPFNWRGWWDFGCGALGDMACHIMDPAYWACDLSNPISVECTYQEGRNDETAPTKSIVRYEFPERVNQYASEYMGKKVVMPALKVWWYEGGLLPERPAGVPEDEQLGEGDNGSLFIGESGVLTTGCYGGGTRVLPAKKHEEMKEVIDAIEPIIPRITTEGGHRRDWVRSCKDGVPSASNFEYAVPLTETTLLGNLAMRTGRKVWWDAKNMRATNDVPGVEELIRRDYRRGWDL
ncbi:MAG: Gfo/Idh/MocA family oxidoreductase [bacterium]|nr:Gfo/Idh/MocA family oxidoreductase [bacterium]